MQVWVLHVIISIAVGYYMNKNLISGYNAVVARQLSVRG